MMDRRKFMATTAGALFALPAGLRAQATPRRIAFLSAFPRADIEVALGLIRAELEKLGWTDGRNIVLLEPRTAEGRNELLPAMAAELVAQNPDLILTQSLPATRSLVQRGKSLEPRAGFQRGMSLEGV